MALWLECASVIGARSGLFIAVNPGCKRARGYTMKSQLTETAVRSRARRARYVARKSRRQTDLDNLGRFMLVDAETNLVVLGSRFDATLTDVVNFLTAH
jgi:hypothetical protein